jgi:peptidyl-prolyl cis-trans isomerase C
MTVSLPRPARSFRTALAAMALAGCATVVFVGAGQVRAQDANPVLAKVNGVEIRQSDLNMAEEELGASQLAQMDAATKRENLLSYVIDLKIVAKAAEDKKLGESDDFKKSLAFARERLLMDKLLTAEARSMRRPRSRWAATMKCAHGTFWSRARPRPSNWSRS